MIETKIKKQAYFFNPVKSPLLWLFCSLHVLFAIALGDIHALAPDENNYMNIARDSFTTCYSTADILGWRNTQVWFLRVAYFPTHVLTSIGLPDYLAIRFESVLLCTIALYLMICLLRLNPSKYHLWLVVLICATPSIFIWMTLGLRESFIFLSLAMLCTGVIFFIRRDYLASFTNLTLGNLILFETKQLLFLLSVGALALTFLFSVISVRAIRLRHILVLATVVIPMVVFPAGTALTVDTLRLQMGFVASTGQTGIAEYAESVESGSSGNGITTTDLLRGEIAAQPRNLIVRVLKLTGIDKKLGPSSVTTGDSTGTSQSDEQVVSPRSSKLDVIPASISDPLSVISRSAAFLFTPFPLVDNGSLFTNVAALESPIWWLLYVVFGLAIWRRFLTKTMDELAIFVLGYSVAFLLFSALTEINLGTLTRHRSVFIIPFLFLILSTPKKSQVAE